MSKAETALSVKGGTDLLEKQSDRTSAPSGGGRVLLTLLHHSLCPQLTVVVTGWGRGGLGLDLEEAVPIEIKPL